MCALPQNQVMPGQTSKTSKTRKPSWVREVARIVKAIRDRHQRRLPLNIHAMKREDPALLDAAFEVRPFLGWKQAVELALGGYDRIRVELEEFVICEICGAERKILQPHIEKKHEIPIGEYCRRFPGAPVTAEAIRATRMNASEILPHWEPLWSVEYAVDRVFAWHQAGEPVNIDNVYSYDRPLRTWTATHCGSWDDVLRAAGLDPGEHRIHSAPATAKEVLDFIRERARQGLQLNRRYVHEHFYVVEGGAKRLFGSWADAIRAAGFDSLEFAQRPAYSRKELISLIRELKRGGQALNYQALDDAGLGKIYVAGIRHFGSWDEALKAAGYSPAHHRINGPTPGPEQLLALIRKRVQAGKAVNTQALSNDKLSKWTKLGRRYFGSWDQALAGAGLDPAQHRRYAPPMSEERLKKIIREWAAQGDELSYAALRRAGSCAPYNAGLRLYGSWYEAIRKAGVRPEDHGVRKRSR